MARIDRKAKKIQAKVVYYGPGLCGKTTNLEWVNKNLTKGQELMSLATEGDRTIFFDFMPIELGKLWGMDVQFKLYTVPGQVRYNQTRKMVLKNVDGIVFVADSQPGMMDSNIESLENLYENLAELGIAAESISLVLQYNKRDLPGALSREELDAALNKDGVPTFDAVAFSGTGVVETLRAACSQVLGRLAESVRSTATPSVASREPATPGQAVGRTTLLGHPGAAPAPAAAAEAQAKAPPEPLPAAPAAPAAQDPNRISSVPTPRSHAVHPEVAAAAAVPAGAAAASGRVAVPPAGTAPAPTVSAAPGVRAVPTAHGGIGHAGIGHAGVGPAGVGQAGVGQAGAGQAGGRAGAAGTSERRHTAPDGPVSREARVTLSSAVEEPDLRHAPEAAAPPVAVRAGGGASERKPEAVASSGMQPATQRTEVAEVEAHRAVARAQPAATVASARAATASGHLAAAGPPGVSEAQLARLEQALLGVTTEVGRLRASVEALASGAAVAARSSSPGLDDQLAAIGRELTSLRQRSVQGAQPSAPAAPAAPELVSGQQTMLGKLAEVVQMIERLALTVAKDVPVGDVLREAKALRGSVDKIEAALAQDAALAAAAAPATGSATAAGAAPAAGAGAASPGAGDAPAWAKKVMADLGGVGASLGRIRVDVTGFQALLEAETKKVLGKLESAPRAAADNGKEPGAQAELQALSRAVAALPGRAELDALAKSVAALPSKVEIEAAAAARPGTDGALPSGVQERLGQLATHAEVAALAKRLEMLPSKAELEGLVKAQAASGAQAAPAAAAPALPSAVQERLGQLATHAEVAALAQRVSELPTKSDMAALGQRLASLPTRGDLEALGAGLAAALERLAALGAAPAQGATPPPAVAGMPESAAPKPTGEAAKPARKSVRPESAETKPARKSARPESAEAKPARESARPESAEAKPARESAKPESAEAKPARKSARPESAEAKPARESGRPGGAEAKPARESARPGGAEAKPARESVKPESAEAKPADEAAKPAGEAAAAVQPSAAAEAPAAATPAASGDEVLDDKEHQNAARIARVMIADLYLYNKADVDAGILAGDFYERNKEALADIRLTYESRVSALLREQKDHLSLAIEAFLDKKRKQLLAQQAKAQASDAKAES